MTEISKTEQPYPEAQGVSRRFVLKAGGAAVIGASMPGTVAATLSKIPVTRPYLGRLFDRYGDTKGAYEVALESFFNTIYHPGHPYSRFEKGLHLSDSGGHLLQSGDCKKFTSAVREELLKLKVAIDQFERNLSGLNSVITKPGPLNRFASQEALRSYYFVRCAVSYVEKHLKGDCWNKDEFESWLKKAKCVAKPKPGEFEPYSSKNFRLYAEAESLLSEEKSSQLPLVDAVNRLDTGRGKVIEKLSKRYDIYWCSEDPYSSDLARFFDGYIQLPLTRWKTVEPVGVAQNPEFFGVIARRCVQRSLDQALSFIKLQVPSLKRGQLRYLDQEFANMKQMFRISAPEEFTESSEKKPEARQHKEPLLEKPVLKPKFCCWDSYQMHMRTLQVRNGDFRFLPHQEKSIRRKLSVPEHDVADPLSTSCTGTILLITRSL